MALTELKVRNAKVREKLYKLFDERGLYLLISPSGSRLWRLRYTLNGRENMLSLGAYPDVPLARAREKRDEARRLIADGVSPSLQRKATRAAHADTFAAIAEEWLLLRKPSFAATTYDKARWMLVDLIGPYIGARPIRELTAPDVLAVLRRIEASGRIETAHRAKQRASHPPPSATKIHRRMRTICTPLAKTIKAASSLEADAFRDKPDPAAVSIHAHVDAETWVQLREVAAALALVENQVRAAPRAQADWRPIDRIHRALLDGFNQHGTKVRPGSLVTQQQHREDSRERARVLPRVAVRGPFERIAAICYEAAGLEKSPERPIKRFLTLAGERTRKYNEAKGLPSASARKVGRPRK